MVEYCEEINFSSLALDDDEKQFHIVIGHIEDILMDDHFLEIHTDFMEKYWREFEESEENKFVYTDIFEEYIATIEKHIENELSKRMELFNMAQFEKELKAKNDELDGEIFEMLSTFTDFCAFKMMFLDYKNMKEGKSVDFSSDLNVTKYIIENTM